MSAPIIVSHGAIHPRVAATPSTLALSIADSSVANLAPTGGTWFFQQPEEGAHIHASSLTLALQHTLGAYSHFGGSLSLRAPAHGVTHAHSARYGRVWVRFGHDDDPGVGLTVASWDRPMRDVLPLELDGAVDSAPASAAGLIDASGMASLREGRAGYGVVVQITSFSDGGLAVSVLAHHCLMDAHALAVFVGDWAKVHTEQNRLRADGFPTDSFPRRLFSPELLDKHAVGDIDHEAADELIVAVADRLPQLKLDFWARRPGHPEDLGPVWFKAPRDPPPAVRALDEAAGHRRGPRVPWEEWDTAAPVLDRTIVFSPQQIERLYAAAHESGTPSRENSSQGTNGHASGHHHRVSRLDAVLASVWAAIVRARNLPPETDVYLETTLGLRSRVLPPLGDAFVGSPIINCSSALPAGALTAATGARAIRNTITEFSPPAVGAMLHRMAFVLDPAREWNCFLGERHVLTTSWLGIGVYDTDFGIGRPLYVHANMPPCDGLLVAMDLADTRKGAKWHESGLSVRLMLRAGVMEQVLVDHELRGVDLSRGYR
ncbi:hypothetical protein Q8F55_003064 [Vanrija albida]|uniref:Condensation domain-containing protein n=1 Tax=Vanrija albida TaxID=181172 RepID=A0ABR3QC26_9TREE